MRCNKCGGEINTVHLNVFDKEGIDSEESIPFTEGEEDAVVMDVDSSWVGYGLSEEEQIEDIRCPICGEFPFSQNEVQVYDIVRIVCFHEKECESATEKTSVALTDEEIKRALLCCTLSRSRADCLQMCCPASTSVSCSYFLRTDEDFEDVLYVELIKDALDLINRKQEEVERLQKELALKGSEYTLLERDRAKDICDFAEELQTIKAEAIKEFIKNLKEKKHECGCNYRKKPVYAVTEEKIDETYKEMVGDEDVLD